ncbi:MAG: hypothetical protein WD342_12660 [Verrucomicrobiales bacterium]
MITEILHLAGSRPDLLHPSSVTALTVLPLGFFLGMRHATDPDHVATVTNFVIRKNSVRAAVSIGGLWGLGHTISILAVGLVHGLAGSAALTLMVVPILQTPSLALGYLFLFGAGSIAGMIVITAAIALPCARLADRSVFARRHLSTAAGVLSIAIGLFLVFQVATANQPFP